MSKSPEIPYFRLRRLAHDTFDYMSRATGGLYGSAQIEREHFWLLFNFASKSNIPFGANIPRPQIEAMGQTISSTDGLISRRDWVRWWLRYNHLEEDSDDDDNESSVHEHPRTLCIDQAKTVWKSVLDNSGQPPHATIMRSEHFSRLFRGAMRQKIPDCCNVPDAICDEYRASLAVTAEVDGRLCDCITLDRWIEFWLRHNRLDEDSSDDDDDDDDDDEASKSKLDKVIEENKALQKKVDDLTKRMNLLDSIIDNFTKDVKAIKGGKK